MEHRHDAAVAVVVDERDTTVHVELVTPASAIVSHVFDSIAQSPATSGMISRPKISSGSISCTFGMLNSACCTPMSARALHCAITSLGLILPERRSAVPSVVFSMVA